MQPFWKEALNRALNVLDNRKLNKREKKHLEFEVTFYLVSFLRLKTAASSSISAKPKPPANADWLPALWSV